MTKTKMPRSWELRGGITLNLHFVRTFGWWHKGGDPQGGDPPLKV